MVRMSPSYMQKFPSCSFWGYCYQPGSTGSPLGDWAFIPFAKSWNILSGLLRKHWLPLAAPPSPPNILKQETPKTSKWCYLPSFQYSLLWSHAVFCEEEKSVHPYSVPFHEIVIKISSFSWLKWGCHSSCTKCTLANPLVIHICWLSHTPIIVITIVSTIHVKTLWNLSSSPHLKWSKRFHWLHTIICKVFPTYLICSLTKSICLGKQTVG